MRKIQESKDNVAESILLGVYADTRQWEDEMWLADPIGEEGDLPDEPDDDDIHEDDDGEHVAAEENSE